MKRVFLVAGVLLLVLASDVSARGRIFGRIAARRAGAACCEAPQPQACCAPSAGYATAAFAVGAWQGQPCPCGPAVAWAPANFNQQQFPNFTNTVVPAGGVPPLQPMPAGTNPPPLIRPPAETLILWTDGRGRVYYHDSFLNR